MLAPSSRPCIFIHGPEWTLEWPRTSEFMEARDQLGSTSAVDHTRLMLIAIALDGAPMIRSILIRGEAPVRAARNRPVRRRVLRPVRRNEKA